MAKLWHREAMPPTLSREHGKIVFVAVVGHDQRLCGEEVKQSRQRLLCRRRCDDVSVGDAVDARRLSRNRNTRIDKAAVRDDAVRGEDHHSPLDDASGLRRLGGGFEVEGGEVMREIGVAVGHAARCGLEDAVVFDGRNKFSIGFLSTLCEHLSFFVNALAPQLQCDGVVVAGQSKPAAEEGTDEAE